MYEGMLAETVRLKGHGGDEIDAYLGFVHCLGRQPQHEYR